MTLDLWIIWIHIPRFTPPPAAIDACIFAGFINPITRVIFDKFNKAISKNALINFFNKFFR